MWLKYLMLILVLLNDHVLTGANIVHCTLLLLVLSICNLLPSFWQKHSFQRLFSIYHFTTVSIDKNGNVIEFTVRFVDMSCLLNRLSYSAPDWKLNLCVSLEHCAVLDLVFYFFEKGVLVKIKWVVHANSLFQLFEISFRWRITRYNLCSSLWLLWFFFFTLCCFV